eukprot:Skav206949  [mRNA]  locus=scaffold1304:121683:129494:- [translate_table: standard]
MLPASSAAAQPNGARGIAGRASHLQVSGSKRSVQAPLCGADTPAPRDSERPPRTCKRPFTATAAHRERAVNMSGRTLHFWPLGSKRSAEHRAFCPSWPPTTYSCPPNVHAAQP